MGGSQSSINQLQKNQYLEKLVSNKSVNASDDNFWSKVFDFDIFSVVSDPSITKQIEDGIKILSSRLGLNYFFLKKNF